MKLLRPILLGGLVAGALDITYAFIHFGIAVDASPIRIGQSVAAGLVGTEVAFSGGVGMGLFGLVLHFLMATMMAAFFVVMASRIPALIRQPWITGPAYGLGLYFVMNYLVVPMSNAAHHGPPQGQFLIGALFTHTVLVGLPIALIAKRYLGK